MPFQGANPGSIPGRVTKIYMIIDSHTHLTRLRGTSTEKPSFEESLKLLQKEMKINNVAMSIIIANYHDADTDSFPAVQTVLDLTKGMENIRVAGTVRLPGCTTKDLDMLEAWLKNKEIVAVKLYSGYQHFYPNDPICTPIYELCIKYDVPVIFHSGDTFSVDEKAKLKYSHPLILDDVATDFPDLKIIIAHLGSPWINDCSEVIYKNDNVYADISGLVVGSLDGKFASMVKRQIGDLITYNGSAKKLLYGTDWPLASMDSYINFTQSLDIPKEELDEVFYKNAVRIFKLK